MSDNNVQLTYIFVIIILLEICLSVEFKNVLTVENIYHVTDDPHLINSVIIFVVSIGAGFVAMILPRSNSVTMIPQLLHSICELLCYFIVIIYL